MAISLGPFKYPVPGAIPGEYLVTGFDAALSVSDDSGFDVYYGTVVFIRTDEGGGSDLDKDMIFGFSGEILALINNPVDGILVLPDHSLTIDMGDSATSNPDGYYLSDYTGFSYTATPTRPVGPTTYNRAWSAVAGFWRDLPLTEGDTAIWKQRI